MASLPQIQQLVDEISAQVSALIERLPSPSTILQIIPQPAALPGQNPTAEGYAEVRDGWSLFHKTGQLVGESSARIKAPLAGGPVTLSWLDIELELMLGEHHHKILFFDQREGSINHFIAIRDSEDGSGTCRMMLGLQDPFETILGDVRLAYGSTHRLRWMVDYVEQSVLMWVDDAPVPGYIRSSLGWREGPNTGIDYGDESMNFGGVFFEPTEQVSPNTFGIRNVTVRGGA